MGRGPAGPLDVVDGQVTGSTGSPGSPPPGSPTVSPALLTGFGSATVKSAELFPVSVKAVSREAEVVLLVPAAGEVACTTAPP